jgi:hypothetical protein
MAKKGINASPKPHRPISAEERANAADAIIVDPVAEKLEKEEQQEIDKRIAAERAAESKDGIVVEESGPAEEIVLEGEGVLTEETPKWWRDKLHSLITGAKERLAVGERGERLKNYLAERGKKLGAGLRSFSSNIAGDLDGAVDVITHPIEMGRSIRSGVESAAGYVKYFADRNVSLAQKGEKLKVDLKTLTESYNKLPPRQKLYITAALIGSSSVAAVAALPTLSAVLAGGMYGVRALGGAGFALNRRKGMEARIEKNSEHWLANKSGRFKNTYAAALGAAYTGGTAVAGHYAMESLADWLGHHHLFSSAEESSASPYPEFVHEPVVAHTAPAPGAGEAIVLPPAVEMPTADAVPGHGYEYMAKQLAEKLHEMHLNPNDYPEGSDIRQLLEANDSTIDGVVHNIAVNPEYHLFNADGTSVRIGLNAHMTIDADGQIRLDGAIKASEVVPVDSAPHPVEPTVSPEEAVSTAKPFESISSMQPSEAPATPTEVLHKPFESISSMHPAEAPTTPTEVLHKPFESISSMHPAEMPIAPTEVLHKPFESISSMQPPEAPDSELHLETSPPVEAPVAVPHEIISNHFGLEIPTAEPHIYAGVDSAHTFVFGGTPVERANAILDYLTRNPNGVVFAADDSGAYRIPWHFVDGQITPGMPVRTHGFFGFFSKFMGPPELDDLRKLIK